MVSLLLPLFILLVGAAVLLFLPTLRPNSARHLQWAAAGVVAAALLAVLLTGRDTGVFHSITSWSPNAVLTPSLAMQGGRAGRLLGAALAAITLAAVLIAPRTAQANPPIRWPLALVTLAATLLTLLPANLLTVALAWTALDGVTAAAWLFARPEGDRQLNPLLSWGTGAAGTLLLWAAALWLQADLAFQRISSLGVAGAMGTALVLAIALRLAPFPFHLGRPQPQSRFPELELGLQFAPVAAGAWLLTQIPTWEYMPLLAHRIFSALLLTGVVGSGLLAWLPLEDRRAMRWVVTGLAGLTLLAGLWAGAEAALAEGITLILAGGLFMLLAGRQTATLEIKIAAGLGVAALAGLPLTFGGAGRLALYASWVGQGGGLYLLLGAGACLLLLGAASKALFRPAPAAIEPVDRILVGIGLGLPALGLLHTGPLPAGNAAVWLAIAAPLIGGALGAWSADSLRPLQQEIEPWLHPLLSLRWLRNWSASVGRVTGRATHAAHQVLEGEGALLWVAVLLALGWFLLTNR